MNWPKALDSIFSSLVVALLILLMFKCNGVSLW